MKLKKMKEKTWYNGAVIACIGVAFYFLLLNFPVVMSYIRYFLHCFSPVFLAVIIAYIINPLAKFFYYRILKKMKVGKTRWIISVFLAFVVAMIAFNLLMVALIPQLVQSVVMFSSHLNDYIAALRNLLKNTPLEMVFGDQLEAASQNIMSSISRLLSENTARIMNTAAGYGKNILTSLIALILAVYFLLDKKRVMTGAWRLIRGVFRKKTVIIMDFMLRCDTILVSYMAQSLLDALIVGCTNAIFMAVCRMQYIGLISVVVGVTNLVPNFGPFIGGLIGGLILLLVNPRHAMMFVIFTLLLQLVDGYILKPKLFSGSLGVSGLLILINTVVLGNMMGILGVLLSIPAAAVFSFIYNDYFMPWLEKRPRA